MGTDAPTQPEHYVARLKLDKIPEILTESQAQRDEELAAYLGLPLEEVAAWPILGPDALRFIGDPEAFYRKPLTEERLVAQYRTYPDLNLGHHLKTVMNTSVFGRAYELFDLLELVEPGDRVLDFGCGVGTHTIMFLQSGCVVDLLDVTGPVYALAQQRIQNRGLQAHAYLEHDAILVEVAYDYIVCTDVLEHLLHPFQAVLRLIRALKPGGILHVLMSEKHVETWGHIGAAQDDWKINRGPAYLETHLEKINAYNFRKRDD